MMEDETAGARETHGKNDKCIKDYGGGNLKVRDYVGDLDAEGTILNGLKCLGVN